MFTVEWFIKQYMRGSWELRCNARRNLDVFEGANLSEGNSPYEPKLRDRIRGQKIHLTNAIKLLDTARKAMERVLRRHQLDWPYPEYPNDRLGGRMMMVPHDIDPDDVRGDAPIIVFPETLDQLIENNAIFASDIVTGHNRGAFIHDEVLNLITPDNAALVTDFLKVLEASTDGCAWSRECLGDNLATTIAQLSTDQCDQNELRSRFTVIPLDAALGGDGLLAAVDPDKVAAHAVQ